LDPNGKVNDDTAKAFANELGYLAYFVNGLLTMPPLLNRDLHFGIANNAFDFATQAILTVESPIIPQFYQAKLKPVIEQFPIMHPRCYHMPEEITVPRAHIHPAIRSIMVRMATPSPPAEFAYAAMRQLDQFDSALHRNVQSQHSCQVGCICDAAAVVSLPTAAQPAKNALGHTSNSHTGASARK